MQRSPIKTLAILSTLILIAASISFPVRAQSETSLIIHDIQGKPQSEEFAYDMSVYFSLYDSNGQPIRDLALADVSLTEDGKRVDAAGLAAADQDPINVAILMDTSGSMAGTKIEAARRAAARFISDLQDKDQAALVSFNTDVKTESDFTENLPKVQQKIELLDAEKQSGTCFYDALYSAIQLSASIPDGRRAIVVLTDGVDTLPNGATCSKYTDQDIIDLATRETTRVPLYTLGLGNSVDTKGLERLAARTGGLYQFAADPGGLDQVFESLAEQLRSQYRLNYVSIAAPGPHVLALKVDTSSIHEQNSHDFLLQSFPYRVVFDAPKDGEKVVGETKLRVQVPGQGESIAKVEFFADGQSIGTVEAPPYEITWNPPAGSSNAKLEAAVFGEAGGQLARSSINVAIDPTSPGLTATPPTSATPVLPPVDKKVSTTSYVLIGLVLAVILAIVIVIIFMSAKRKRHEEQRDREWKEKVQTEPTPSANLVDDRTMDTFMTSDDALGVLVVLQSDDPMMVGQRIEIAKPVTNLGRKADNEVIFAKDAAVSRHHAVIEERGGKLFLSEVIAMDEGSPKRPAYGTFLNGDQIEFPVLLKNGDEIRLGKRVRLRFEGLHSTNTDDERTVDQFDSGDERTVDLGN
jgi:Ca-activated chloride channel homolog